MEGLIAMREELEGLISIREGLEGSMRKSFEGLILKRKGLKGVFGMMEGLKGLHDSLGRIITIMKGMNVLGMREGLQDVLGIRE